MLLVCDLDGTLIDSRKDLATGVNLMREEYGLEPLGVEKVTDYIGNGAEKLVERALKGEDVNLEKALLCMLDFYHDHMCDETELYPGVEKGLNLFVESGWVLAIVTNKLLKIL